LTEIKLAYDLSQQDSRLH